VEIPKTQPVTYDGKDAFATLIAEYGGKWTDAQAKVALEKALRRASPRRRRVAEKLMRELEVMLSVAPVAWRREIMVRAATKLKQKRARRDHQRAFRRQYAALRGSKMLVIAGWFFCEETVANVFVPIASDYVLEYRQARAEGRWKAFVVKMRHWHAFANACGLEKAYPWIERFVALLVWLWHKF